jgi:hypothetical protein
MPPYPISVHSVNSVSSDTAVNLASLWLAETKNMSWQSRFSVKRVEEMKDAFNLFDRNGDGTICSQVIYIPDITSLNKVPLHCKKYWD